MRNGPAARSVAAATGVRQRRSILFRTAFAAAGAVALTLFLTLVVSPSADAYAFKGCQYKPDSIDPIEYKYQSVTSAYETAFGAGQSAWDGTNSPGYFAEDSTSLDPEIDVTDGTYTGTFWAQTSYSCESTGYYSGNENTVRFDTDDMSGLSANEKKIVAEHELGHTYGLDDTQDTGCRVMRQGYYKFTCGTMPASDDIAGVNDLY